MEDMEVDCSFNWNQVNQFRLIDFWPNFDWMQHFTIPAAAACILVWPLRYRKDLWCPSISVENGLRPRPKLCTVSPCYHQSDPDAVSKKEKWCPINVCVGLFFTFYFFKSGLSRPVFWCQLFDFWGFSFLQPNVCVSYSKLLVNKVMKPLDRSGSKIKTHGDKRRDEDEGWKELEVERSGRRKWAVEEKKRMSKPQRREMIYC